MPFCVGSMATIWPDGRSVPVLRVRIAIWSAPGSMRQKNQMNTGRNSTAAVTMKSTIVVVIAGRDEDVVLQGTFGGLGSGLIVDSFALNSNDRTDW